MANTSWENLLGLSIEDLDQAEASQVLSLQEAYKAHQTKKQSFENTIYIEPAKLPEVVDATEKLLLLPRRPYLSKIWKIGSNYKNFKFPIQ